MSTRFDAAGDKCYATTNLIDYNATYTFMGWFKAMAASITFNECLAVDNGSNFVNNDIIRLNTNALVFQMNLLSTGGADTYSGKTIVVGRWYHVTMARFDGTTCYGYLNGILDITGTRNVGTARPAVSQNDISHLGGNNNFAAGNNCVAYVKAWNRCLTPGEIFMESRSAVPLTRAGLVRYHPFQNEADAQVDYSGYGRTLTKAGTLTSEDEPPVYDIARTYARGRLSGVVGRAYILGQAMNRAASF